MLSIVLLIFPSFCKTKAILSCWINVNQRWSAQSLNSLCNICYIPTKTRDQEKRKAKETLPRRLKRLTVTKSPDEEQEESGTNAAESEPLVTGITATGSRPDIHLVSSHMSRPQTGFVWPVMPQQISFDFNPLNLHSWRTALKMLVIPEKNLNGRRFFFKWNYERCVETQNRQPKRLCSPGASWDSRFSATPTRQSVSMTRGCQEHIPLCYAKCRMPGEGSTGRDSRKLPGSPSSLWRQHQQVSIQEKTTRSGSKKKI